MPGGSEDGEIIVVTSILGYTKMGCPEVMSGIRLGAPVHQCGSVCPRVRSGIEIMFHVVGSNFRSFDTLILLRKHRRNDYILIYYSFSSCTDRSQKKKHVWSFFFERSDLEGTKAQSSENKIRKHVGAVVLVLSPERLLFVFKIIFCLAFCTLVRP